MSPCEWGQSKDALYDDVCHQPAVPAVAVRKAMDADQAMLEAQGHFVWGEGVVCHPITEIVQQLAQFKRNQMMGYAQILLAIPVLASPFPDFSVHLQMQL